MCYIENQSTRRVLSKFFENFLQKFMRTIKGWKEFLEINLLVNLSTMLTMCKKERHFGTGNEQFNIFLDFSVNLFVCYVNWAYFLYKITFKSSLKSLNQIKPNLAWMVLGNPLWKLFQPHPPFKMATVTTNRNFFNCLLLLYYKSNRAQIVTAATWQWVVQHIFHFFCQICCSDDLLRLCILC